MTAKNRRSRRDGFTLLEVMLVVGILVMLAAFALPNIIGAQTEAQKGTTKTQVKAFDDAFRQYRIRTGDFPTNDVGFQALVNGPGNAQGGQWTPIMTNDDINKLDPWNSRYNYQFPGSKNPLGATAPDIWSNGPDKASGTADDIGNWSGGN
jgi:general secretion pathway protein G